jgi:hypothetical protein
MAANVAQLKHAIDSGKTGDKIGAYDPAMASIGTDDEAAGTPITHKHLAREFEERKLHESGSGRRWLWVAMGAIVLAAVLWSAQYI